MAGLLPVLFLPDLVDAYVLPRAALALAGAGLLTGAGLVFGRGSLGSLRWPAVAVATAAMLAAIASVAPALSLVGAYGRYESLPMRLAYLGLFCGSAWLGERTRLVAAFCCGCSLAAVEAMWQAATHALPRADGNLGQPDLLGALLAMAVPLALERAWAARWRPAAVTCWPWLGLAGLCAGGLAASTSRSAWLGALVGVAVLVVLRVPSAWRRRALVVAVAPALAALVILASPLRDLNQDTGAARLGVWRDSLVLVAHRPLTGWGEDTMGLVFGRFQSADWEPGHSFDRAHDVFLDLAASQGLVGLVACGWLFASWWRRAAGRALAGDAAVAGIAGAVAAYGTWASFNFDWAPATAPLWLLAGAAVSLPARRRPGRWRPAAAAAAALLGLALALPPVLADAAYADGNPLRAAGLDPLQARYWAAQGTLSGLRRAQELGDPDPDDAVALGQSELRAGDRAAAAAAFRAALRLYPYDVSARLALEGLRRLSGTRAASS